MWTEDYNFNFYTVTEDNKLVVGFDDREEAEAYAKRNRYKVFTRNGLKNKKIDPSNIDNWTDYYPSL